MSGNAGGFEDDPLVVPGSYSQLLLGDEISGLQTDGCSGFTSSFPPDDNIIISSPKMLCFGDYAKQCNMKVAVESAKKTGQKFGPACEDSSLPVSNKKRNGSGTNERTGFQSGTPVESLRNSKKPKPDNSTVSGHAKVVKREKLGDRITALQQLVSPFGKLMAQTDTTSVLHEALGYIKFLHEQVQVLCSPYLQFSEDLHHPDLGQPNYFIGLEVTNRITRLFIEQGKYIRSILQKANMTEAKECITPVITSPLISEHNGQHLKMELFIQELFELSNMI